MVKINHARHISRIGFVVQDTKDLQSEVLERIQTRSNEINNSSAECILNAQEDLELAAEKVGGGINYAARNWQTLNDALFTGVIDLSVNDLSLVISLLEVELLNLFGLFNPVTNIYFLLFFFQYEIQYFFFVFELFVDEIYFEMLVYESATEAMNRIVFLTLENYLQEFREAGRSIILSLETCSE